MNGLILLNKPKGVTSFKAVAAVRRIFNEKHVGHTGTLDPMATGVLPVLIGKATRLSDFLLMSDKEYTATLRLGITTDTLDITGKMLSKTAANITENEFCDALSHFRGEIEQTPPMYSAIKQNGQPLYKLARRGIEAEREARRVTVSKLELIGHDAPEDFKISVRCSKGTYIRSLCDDLGKYLGCGAVLTELCRTATGGFTIDECITLEELETDKEKYLMPPIRAVSHLRKINVSEKQAARFRCGGELDICRLNDTFTVSGEAVAVICNDDFCGIGSVDTESGCVRVKCVIN